MKKPNAATFASSRQAPSTQGSGRDFSAEAREAIAEIEEFLVEIRRRRDLQIVAEYGRHLIEVALRVMKDHRP